MIEFVRNRDSDDDEKYLLTVCKHDKVYLNFRYNVYEAYFLNKTS
jgi:hypothetical protein